MRAGHIAAGIYNVARDPKKSKPLTWEDFFPRPEKKAETVLTEEQNYQMFRVWASGHNAMIARRGAAN